MEAITPTVSVVYGMPIYEFGPLPITRPMPIRMVLARSRIDSQAEKTGGVSGKVAQANSPLTNDKSTLSQTDYATESTNLTLAHRAFSANLKAIQAQRQADEATLDTVG